MMHTFIIGLALLTNLVLSYDGVIRVHCDNEVVVKRSDDDGASFTTIGTHTQWHIQYSLTIPSITRSTIVRAECENKGGPGSFIAQMEYKGQIFPTTNPLSDGEWTVVGNVALQYFGPSRNVAIWNVVARSLDPSAWWMWDANPPSTFYTMTFEFDFGDVFDITAPECAAVSTIAGTPCYVWGDPHTRTFNGAQHDYQGQPSTGVNQFYYVRRCNGISIDQMPFSLLGTHYQWGNSIVSGIDYVTLEMVDADGSIYYGYFSSNIAAYAEKAAGANSDYDESAGVAMATLKDGSVVKIGTRFELDVAITPAANANTGDRIYVTLTVDGSCRFQFDMYGYVTNVGGRWRMHSMYIQVPFCYKCASCGLCGDLKRTKLPGYWQQMERCDGSVQQFRPGWSPSITEAYDVQAWTWEQEYADTNCPAATNPTNNYQPDTTNPNDGTAFVPKELCPAAIEPLVKKACDEVAAKFGACCAATGEVCNQLIAGCEADACILADGDPNLVDAAVQSTTTDQLNVHCTPEIQEQFDPVNEQFNDPNTTPSDPLPVTTTGCDAFGTANQHVCGCQSEKCSGGVCNTVESVASKLGVSSATATCPADKPNCCCSCPNCAPYYQV